MTSSRSNKHKPFEIPNKYAIKHGDYVLEETPKAGSRRARNKQVFMLDTYKEKETITLSQYDAGIKLYTLWLRSGLTTKITISYEKIRFGRINNLSEKNMIARQEMLKAFDLVGIDLTHCLIAVCCLGESASSWAKQKSYHTRSGIDFLRLALDRLCMHWKINN